LIVMTLQGESVWLPVDTASEMDLLSGLASWQWDDTSYPEYQRPPSRNGYYKPGADHNQDWEHIQRLHFTYLERLLVRPRTIDPRSAAHHEPLVVEYLSAVLQRTIPSPPSLRLPEEVPISGDYWEGATARVAVNRFERDRGARAECLRR